MLPPGLSPFALRYGDYERRYLVHLPPTPVPPEGWPTVVVLHGMGGTAAWTLAETGWDRFAAEAGCALIVPEALPLDPARPAAFWKNPTTWNDGKESRPSPIDDVGFLDAVLGEARAHFALDVRRLYATGFSNGAAMVFRLAAERPGLFAAIAPVAGYCRVKQPHDLRPVRTLHLVGGADPFVPLDGGLVSTVWGWSEERPRLADVLADWSVRMGGAPAAEFSGENDGVRWQRYPHPEVDFVVGVIDGLGHHWPGGRGELSRRLFGPPNDRVNANRLIGDFLSRAVAQPG